MRSLLGCAEENAALDSLGNPPGKSPRRQSLAHGLAQAMWRRPPSTPRRPLAAAALAHRAAQAYTLTEPLSAVRETSKVRHPSTTRDAHRRAGCPVPRTNGQGIFFC